MSSRAIQTSDIGGDVVIPINRFKQKQHGPYQTYLTGLLGTHPHLQVLEHFIDEDDWENWRVHGHPKDHGLTKFDVIVLDIEPSPGSSTTASLSTSPHLESGEAVKRYTERHRLKDPGSLRLFLAEDLSRDLIEYFGSKYGLDPNFFEGHLRGHERLLSGRPLPKYLSAVHPTPPSVSEASTASYFTAGFYRPYKFGNGDQHSWPIVQKIRWETENVIRHGVAYLKLKSTGAFFLNERFSIIAIPAAASESAMTGIILFDPFLPLPPPRAMCGYRNVISPRPYGSIEDHGAACGTHRALRQDFLDWMKQLDSAELRKRVDSFGRGHELSIAEHLFKVAAANTISFLQEVGDAMEYIENKMHGFWRFNGYELDEEVAADCLQMLRYFTMDIMECTRSTICILNARFRFETRGILSRHLLSHIINLEGSHSSINISCERLIYDFEEIHERLHDVKLRAETDIGYFVARLSSKEAHRAQLQADELKLMNIFIFMLGPISTLASILSIQEKDRHVVVFLLCTLAAFLVVVVSRSWGYIYRKLLCLKDIFNKIDKSAANSADELPFDYMSILSQVRSMERNRVRRRRQNN